MPWYDESDAETAGVLTHVVTGCALGTSDLVLLHYVFICFIGYR